MCEPDGSVTVFRDILNKDAFYTVKSAADLYSALLLFQTTKRKRKKNLKTRSYKVTNNPFIYFCPLLCFCSSPKEEKDEGKELPFSLPFPVS